MKRVYLPRLHWALLGLLPMLPQDRGRRVIRLVWLTTEMGGRSAILQSEVRLKRKGTK